MNPKITVVGLGYGNEDSLSIGTWKILQSGDPILLRTEDHPISPWLGKQGIEFSTFDHIYERHDKFDSVYRQIADELLQLSEEHNHIIYAVPGHPMVAERTVQLLLQEGPAASVKIDIQGGGSFLDIAFARLGIDPVEGFQLLDGTDLTEGYVLVPNQHILIGQVYSSLVASDVKLTLMQVYPDDYEVVLADALGVTGKEKIIRVPLYELDRQNCFTNLTSVYVPPAREESVFYKQFSFLVQIMKKLRGPEGCPWDREQTHESLRPYLIEEAYEFIDAINQEDDQAMLEELGDVLLQVIFHAVVAEERYGFEIGDVIQTLNEKLIRRHPHVFGTVDANTSEEVIQTWDAVKQEEGKNTKDSILDNIPKSFPAILIAYEQQKKAAKVGFDWDSVDGVLDKMKEELTELAEASTPTEREKELGDVLFTVINIARFYKIDPELALYQTTRKFDQRFRHVEKRAKESGQPMGNYTLEQLEIWWQEAKQKERDENNEIG
ncbi:nucleoside triphosphate pyrophosphohydrolase [Shimazuella kribbensis]|uniref:nucleoside triphosphate pyrophosphohydrolase n=1 Tax=Shimazuella kribbensis TaxID=139808 RepID=UPI00041E5CF5|nr:nucleoside triphosphate pyrophosphohydrolase [Shimazuella kribbensis]